MTAAVELATETGMRKVTVDDIARRAGVSRATFYLHFRNRSSLLKAAVDREVERFLEHIRLAPTGDEGSPDWLTETLAQALVTAGGHSALAMMRDRNPEPLRPYLTGMDAAAVTLIASVLAPALSRGGLPDEALERFAEFVSRQFHSLLLAPSRQFDIRTVEGCREYVSLFIMPAFRQALAHGDGSVSGSHREPSTRPEPGAVRATSCPPGRGRV